MSWFYTAWAWVRAARSRVKAARSAEERVGDEVRRVMRCCRRAVIWSSRGERLRAAPVNRSIDSRGELSAVCALAQWLR